MQKVLESVNASNFLLVGNQTGNSTKKTEDDVLNFADFLPDTDSSNTVQKSEPVDKPNEKSDQTEYPNNQTTDSLKKDSVIVKKKDVDKEETASIITDLSEEDEEVIAETIGSVLKMIMEQFGLSKEELTEKLKVFNMDVEELFTVEGLKDFFLNMNSAEVSDLLVNEEMNQELQNFVDKFDELFSENDVSKEQLMYFLENTDAEEVVSEFINNKETNQTVDLSVSDENVISDVMSEQDEPVVIVENQNEQNNTSNENHSEAKKETEFSKDQDHRIDMKTVKQDGFENPILHAIQEAVDQVKETVLSEQPVEGRDVIEQIVEQIRINMNQDTTSMEMQLYPEHLGKIQINVVSKDGVMTARIVAETEAAKQAIESGLTNLKESMQQQNLKVDAIEVMVSTTGFERGNEGEAAFEEKNASKGSKKQIDLSDLEEEEMPDAEVERMKATGSSVSYTA